MPNHHKIPLDHESRLMLKVATGNRKVFEQLYNKYSPILRQFLIKRNSLHLSLEDIVQKVFTRIWEQRKNFRAKSLFQTYLFSIAKNVLSEEENHFRRTNMKRLQTDLITTSELADSQVNADYMNMTKLLYKAVDDLPAKSSQAIKLHYFKNLSTSDAAKFAGCSPQTFRQRLRYARDRLQDMLNRLEHSG